jgi:L-lactate dehydrogenase
MVGRAILFAPPCRLTGTLVDVNEQQLARVVVVGAGHVGSTFAYALLLSGLAAEIVLVDVDRQRAEGEAMDLAHAVPFAPATRIWAGKYGDCAGAAVTVIAAGPGQRPGDTRLDLARRNATIVGDIALRVARENPAAIIVVATNPVDVLTHAAWRVSGLPRERVFGSGTILDTARFRALLAEHLGVDARSVHAFIVGEHGDSEVPVWSLANVAGMGLSAFGELVGAAVDEAVRDELFRRTRDAAYAIIERKGATFFAVAAGLVRIVEAILRDQKTVLSVSSVVDGPYGLRDVALSLPTVIGRGGVERVLELPLAASELEGLRRSASVLRVALDGLDRTSGQ